MGKFNVGDKVVSLIQGHGEVVNVDETDDFGLFVSFNGPIMCFMHCGRVFANDAHPTLYHEGVRIIDVVKDEETNETEELKAGELAVYRSGAFNMWEVGVFSYKYNHEAFFNGSFLTLPVYVVNGDRYNICKPFKGNEHLVGTTSTM